MHLRSISAFVFAASLALTSTALGLVTGGETRLWATTAGWAIAGLAFGAAALAAAVRVGPGRVRTAWLLWTAASAFWVAGAVGRGVLGSASGSLPVPTFADALWCLFAVVSVVGIAVRSARGSFSFPLYALDALPVVLLAAALAQLTATRDAHPSHTQDAFVLAYPIVFVFLALVSTHFITLQGFRRAWRRGSVAFVSGFYLLAAGAVTWAPQTLDGSRVDTFAPGLLWTLGLLVLAGYALFRVLQPAGAAPYYAPERDRGARSIPSAAAMGGLVLLAILSSEGAWAQWLLFAATAAFGARSFLVRQATGRLLDALVVERDFTSAVIETAGSLVSVTDREGRFVRFNRACEELSGYTREEAMGRPFYDLVIPPEEQEEVDARIARVQGGDFPNEGENHWVTRDGERRLISWKNTALLGDDGSVRYVVATGIDITEQRRAEEALARDEERFRTLVASVPGTVFRCALDEHWTMEFLSDGIEEIAGYPASDLVGNRVRTYAGITHPEDNPRVCEVIFGAVAERQPYALEYRVLHADGSVRWVYERGKAHYGADGSALWLDGVFLDVTERKVVEAALAEREQQLSAVFENLPGVVYRCAYELPGSVHFFSDEIERLLGCSPAEFAERFATFAAVIHPDDRAPVHEATRAAVESREPYSLEYRFVRADGAERWISDRGRAAHGPDGEVLWLDGVLFDVTAQKRAEEALAETKQTLEAMIDASPLPIVSFDRSGCVTLWNPAAERAFGWSEEEVLGRPNPMVAEEQRADFLKYVDLVFQGKSWRDVEAVRRRKDGSLIDVSISSAPLRDAGGAVVGVIALLLDVTENKRAEQQLREAEERYRTLVEQIPLVTYLTAFDDCGKVLYVSPQVEAILGYPVEKWLERPAFNFDVIHPADRERVVEEFARWRSDGGVLQSEYRDIARDGRVVWLEDATVAIRDEAGKPLYAQGYLLDITARKEAEEALREAEERHRTLVEQLPAVVYTAEVGLEGRWLYVSPQVESILGYSPEEWTSSPQVWLECIHPDDREFVEAYESDAENLVDEFGYEYRLVARDGRIVWVRDEAAVVSDEAGTPRWHHGFLLDITEQRQAAEQLRESEERFRSYFEYAPTGMTLTSAEGRFVRVNPAFCAIVGYSEEELLDMRFQELIHPDDVVAVEVERQEMLDGTNEKFDVETRYVRKDGSTVWVRVTSSAVRDPDGRPLMTTAQVQDISERRRAEEALRETTQMLEGLIEASPVAIAAVDRDAVVTLWNPAAERMFGWTAEEALGSFNPIAGEAEREEFLGFLTRVIEGESWGDLEVVRRRKDGSQIPLIVSSGPMRSASGEIVGMVSLLVDVTERKLAETERERLVAALSEQNERLRELDRLKDEFVALVSHELRTPLTSIRGYLELIMDGEVGDVTPEQAEFLGIVDRNTLRLLRLVGDLLLVAQIGSGAMNLVVGEVDLRALAAESIAAAAPAAEKKEVSLTLEASKVAALQADRSRLAQALDNFLSNAIKFTPRGGSVTLRIEPLHGAVAIEVADTGMGMTPEERELLFQRFFRTAEATRQAIPGTGLGLTITKGIVEAHGGTVSVESELGVGTTFRVVLPSVASVRGSVDNVVMEEAA